MARNLTYILHHPVTLVIVWIWGLLSGICAYSASGASLFSAMRHAPFCVASIPRLIVVTVFPFLISALAVSFSWSAFLLPIAFAKGCTLAYVTMGCGACSGSFGIPACCLLLARSWAGIPLLFRFWLDHLSGERIHLAEAFRLAGLCLLLVCADYWIISPLLGRVIVW